MNRITEYRRLWKDYSVLLQLSGVMQVSEEVRFESEGLIRFAGVVQVTGPALDEAIDIARSRHGCALIASDGTGLLNRGRITDVFSAALMGAGTFGRDSIDWPGLVSEAIRVDDFALRVTGQFDDPDAGVDIFGSPAAIGKLYEAWCAYPST